MTSAGKRKSLILIFTLAVFFVLNNFVSEEVLSSSLSSGSPKRIRLGLRAEYYNNADLTNLKFIRLDPHINFNWGKNSPGGGIKKDTFSIRWTGYIQPPLSAEYIFSTIENDGIKVWIGDQLIIDDWSFHANTVKSTGSIALTGGIKYKIRVEYFENTGPAMVRLFWSSPHHAKEIVPYTVLSPPQQGGTVSQEPAEILPISSPSLIPTLSSAQEIFLRPMADSFEQDWECFNHFGIVRPHFEAINEELSDDFVSFCKKDIMSISNAGSRNIYKLLPIGNIGQINSISVVAKARKDNINNFPVNLKIGIRNGASEFDGEKEFPVDNLWRYYEVTFDQNPFTGSPWILEDLNSLEIFHKLGSIPFPFGEKLVVTQIYLKVIYTPSPVLLEFVNQKLSLSKLLINPTKIMLGKLVNFVLKPIN